MEQKNHSEEISRIPQESDSCVCEKCGMRPKAIEDGRRRKWCKRCIGIYRRSRLSKQEKYDKFIELAGELYRDADLFDLEDDIHNQIINAKGDVFLYGPVGVGKTYAMAALARHYIDSGYDCCRINFDDFCRLLRSTMKPDSLQTEDGLIRRLVNYDKLFIDDLGLRSNEESDYAYITLFNILNKRMEYSLPTYITSNKDLGSLSESFDYRVVSRLQAGTVIFMDGQDRRTP